MYKKLIIPAVLLIVLLAGGMLLRGRLMTFDYSLQHVVTLSGESVSPDKFLAPVYYMYGITAEFAGTNEFAPGRQEIALQLTNGSRNRRTTGVLYVLTPVEYIKLEYAQPLRNFVPLDFIGNAELVRDMSVPLQFAQLLPTQPPVGQAPIEIMLNGITVRSAINVVDTTPPTADIVNREVLKGEPLLAASFLTNVFDASPIVQLEFVNAPGILPVGIHELPIIVKDYWGNYAIFRPAVTILDNDTPPTIVGARNMEVMRGNAIMFRQGVSAYDAFGRPLRFNVDSGAVNTNVNGVYTATYWVEDAWGLRTEVEIEVRVIGVDPDVVRARADTILDGILRDDMTQVQQARAIFNWISNNVAFAAAIGYESVYEGAFQGLQHRRGNCFVFYALSEVMLTQAGIPNMRIDRVPGQAANHRWNLINPDELGWHHFDTTPSRVVMDRFMFTSTQAEEFTQRVQREIGFRNYYLYDPTLYPEIMR